jgi:hypothetical protein
METSTHSPWVSRLMRELGHEVIVAHAQKVGLKISYACSPQLPEATIRCASQRPSHIRMRALRAPE